MYFFDKFDAQDAKLAELLANNNLLHKFSTDSYPMTLTISRDISPEAQIAMFEQDSGDVSSADSKLVFSFPVGEIGVRVYGRLVISDDLMNKIKGHAKKMRDLYLQAVYAARAEKARLYAHDDVSHNVTDAEPAGPTDTDFQEFFEDEQADADE